MYGQRVAALNERRDVLTPAHTEEALQHGVGAPLLAVSMPTQPGAYRGDLVKAFFDGLPPEGEARRIIADDFGLSEDDTFILLAVALAGTSAAAAGGWRALLTTERRAGGELTAPESW